MRLILPHTQPSVAHEHQHDVRLLVQQLYMVLPRKQPTACEQTSFQAWQMAQLRIPHARHSLAYLSSHIQAQDQKASKLVVSRK